MIRIAKCALLVAAGLCAPGRALGQASRVRDLLRNPGHRHGEGDPMTTRASRRWRRLGVWASVVIMGLAAPHPTAAQAPLSRLEGSRLRVTVWNTPLPALAIGTLTKVTGDTIVLTPPLGPEISVPTDRILRIDRSIRSARPDGGREGFLIGAGVGVMVLKTAFDAHYANDDYNLYASVMLGVPLGGLIGAIIGSERAKEKWAPVELKTAREKQP